MYDGDRVLEETDDSGTVLARYTTADGSYFSPLLHMRRAGNISRFPLYDFTGSVRGLVEAAGAVTDTYTLDAFGVKMAADSGSTTNPYHYGGAWGYLTDYTGFEQLGYRFYWPELGRFVQQDPIGDGMNWYAYAEGNPVMAVDPEGLDLLDDATNFFTGFGDTITFGLTALARRGLHLDCVVNRDSGMYTAGEWTGIAFETVAGGAGGFAKAGAKAPGRVFSLFVPHRMAERIPKWLGGRWGRLGRFIRRRPNLWNGNYVSKVRHYKHDPKYWLHDYPSLGPRWPAGIQQLDRMPWVYSGGAAGAAYGLAGMGMANVFSR